MVGVKKYTDMCWVSITDLKSLAGEIMKQYKVWENYRLIGSIQTSDIYV